MSVEQAAGYREVGIASWYGEETRRQTGGHMTANGEAFKVWVLHEDVHALDGINSLALLVPIRLRFRFRVDAKGKTQSQQCKNNSENSAGVGNSIS